MARINLEKMAAQWREDHEQDVAVMRNLIEQAKHEPEMRDPYQMILRAWPTTHDDWQKDRSDALDALLFRRYKIRRVPAEPC